MIKNVGKVRPGTETLAAYDGQMASIRWRLGCDSGVGGGPWLIDDVMMTDAGTTSDCNSGGSSTVFTDGFESGDTAAWSVSAP